MELNSIHRQNDSSQRVLDSGVRRVRGDFVPVWRFARLDKEWGISMRFRHPLMLLLGGLLSASSVGCSAVTAVVSDTRPAARPGRGVADKYAAIGRVYENQGRYDQAEAMYRKALKQNPHNTELRSSLQQLANRKAGRSLGKVASEAVAKAEAAQNSAAETAVALNAKTSHVQQEINAAARSELKTASLDVEMLENELSTEAGKLSPASFEETVVDIKATISSATEPAQAEPLQSAEITDDANSAENNDSVGRLPSVPLVSAEQILAVVEMPSEHAELLLNGLKHGDSLETQCLAATLLGDCDRANDEIKEALRKANGAATDAYLRLAICDSRIQRVEHDDVTAKCLISLLSTAPADLQVQVCSSMHHFVGSESESACSAALESALKSDSPDLRAGAAIALGDFPQLSESTKAELKRMASSDPVTAVREAATASIERGQPDDSEPTEILVMPRK